MKDQFVPYEQAFKLKELGFDDNCLSAYRNTDGEKSLMGLSNWQNGATYDNHPGFCAAPLWQQAFDWFSDNKKMSSHIIEHVDRIYWRITIKGDKTGTAKGYSAFSTISRQEARIALLDKLIELCNR